MHSALKGTGLDRITIAYPGTDTYLLTPNIESPTWPPWLEKQPKMHVKKKRSRRR